MSELECLIHVDKILEKQKFIYEICQIVKGEICSDTIDNDILSIDVDVNDDIDDYSGSDPDSIFLTYRYILDIGAVSQKISDDQFVFAIANLLNALWSQNYPAVAECHFNELLPFNGEGMQHQLDSRN